MGFVLDAILKKIMIDGPVTVSDGYTSEIIDIDNREASLEYRLTMLMEFPLT